MLKTAVECKVLMTDGHTADIDSASGLSPEDTARFLEMGGIIYFPETPFDICDEDRRFLLSQKQKDAGYHKNVAYKPLDNKLSGMDKKTPLETERLKDILQDYGFQTTALLSRILSPYKDNWTIDFASFRPIEEKGRPMRLRARNDLLHVDSFPTRPVYGDRILRTFTNVNPTQSRVWVTSDTFPDLFKRFKNEVAAPEGSLYEERKPDSAIKKVARQFGLKVNGTTAYDRWMTNFHNFMKENAEFQANTRKQRFEFPPNASWLVFTDMVSHSVLEGQYALEQTYLISQNDLVAPDLAPINILRKEFES